MRAILTIAAVLGLSASALAQEELKVLEPGDTPAVEAPAAEPPPVEVQVQRMPAEIRAEQLDILFARLHKSDGSVYQTEDELGQRMSGGCQRQAALDAQFMWVFADIGTPVYVV